MTASDYLISCDWGTSSFRLHLVRRSDGHRLHRLDNGLGIKALFDNWRQSGKPPRLDFFLKYLDFRIYLLGKKAGRSLEKVPVLISGMASSSIGIRELPYATLPFSLTGADLHYAPIRSAAAEQAPVYLCSGLRSRHDVMRGEESQLIGLAGLLGEQPGVAILPGTHSKHIHLENGKITNFHTFMTGEFFALLSRHSILSASLDEAKKTTAVTGAVFGKGVVAAQTHHLLSAAFHVRTNELLHGLSPADNRDFLSGLLIGSELTALPTDTPVYLCGGDKLQEPYRRALQLLSHREVTVIPATEVEGAVAQAHVGVANNILGDQ